jgi:hypothetical protein
MAHGVDRCLVEVSGRISLGGEHDNPARRDGLKVGRQRVSLIGVRRSVEALLSSNWPVRG